MVSQQISRRNALIGRCLLLLLVTALAACASNPPAEKPSPSTGGDSDAAIDQGRTGQSSSVDSAKLDQRSLKGVPKDDRRQFVDPDNPLSTRTIYFPFDSSRVQGKFRDAVQAHADYLADHPDVDLRLEGHTDERGTREYNVALGERRAESVQKALEIAGAGSGQLSTLSFGEEKPAELGSSDEAYRKNRRVELIYVDN